MWEITTRDAQETERLGEVLGRLVRPGDAVLLFGDLGAGKTTFTRGLARGTGAAEPVTSPTFTLLHLYAGRVPVHHFDLYRWREEEDLANLGVEEYLYGDGVAVVEWPEKLGSWTPDDRLEVEFRLTPEGRRLTVTGRGARGSALAAEFREAACGGAYSGEKRRGEKRC